jgi:hypothetical protein
VIARRNLKEIVGPDRKAALQAMEDKEIHYGARGLAEISSHHGWEAEKGSGERQ